MHLKQIPERITAVLCAALLGCAALTGCSGTQDSSTSAGSAAESSAAAETEPPAETEPATEAPTEHISPTETVTSTLGVQLDAEATLNRDSADDAGKNCKAPLRSFIREGDRIESFTFVFYADGNIGTYKGGCGISVTGDCPAATGDGWYQSADFESPTQGGYGEVTWTVPEEIRDYIDPDGEIQIGYWWGGVSTVSLRQMICNYTRSAVLPVDGTQTLTVGQTLRFDDDDAKTAVISVGDLLGEEGIPQAVTFDMTGSGGFGKFTGGFGVSGGGEPYQSDTVAVLTDASTLSLTWILPDTAKHTGISEISLGYWWGEAAELTLNAVTVKYSIGNGGLPAESSKPTESSKPDIKEDTPVSINSTQAARIASEIRIGWNLGNTLDSFDDKGVAKDLETYWGNIKTTKEMISAVKAKGFNAVRIPVSWGNHMDEAGNVDSAWMNRVQEVVDYAHDQDMYVILNVHHDDYLWIHPVYAEESAVTEKYTHLWEQIAERFKDYDEKLLFEGLNEPRMTGTANEWTGGTDEERTVINHLEDAFIRTVRASGGSNADRTLIIPTHAASITDAAVNGLAIPADKNVIVSIHNYAPWKLTTREYSEIRSFDQAGKDELNAGFDKLRSKFIAQGVPVIIGEFGAEDKDNTTVRAAYYAYYVQAAAERGIPCFIWDNGLEESYGLLDRKNNSWFYPEIVDAAINAVK